MIRISELVGRAFTYISIALMLLLSIPIAYEAVVRSFGYPTIWVFETTLYSFIFLGFLGNVLAVKSGAHFRVTLLADLFPNARRAFDLLAHVSVLLFAVLIISSGSYFRMVLVDQQYGLSLSARNPYVDSPDRYSPGWRWLVLTDIGCHQPWWERRNPACRSRLTEVNQHGLLL
ncbi:MAG: TRAP transporter small permease subunit [Marinobacter sp.]|nr:TRAP transporter small permease subunit [Marinobacter sp.]